MKATHYLAINLVGLACIIFSTAYLVDYSELLAGILVGIGLSVAAFSLFRLLVDGDEKSEKTYEEE